NTRRPIFADIRVREAITLLFDFEWANRSLFFGRYRRLGSYFEASELSSHGRPADAAERALLAPFPDAVRADVMEGTWSPPVSDGSGRDRDNLGQALALLENAGFELRNNRLVSRATGQPFTFEFLVATREDERLAMLFARDLRRAGIAMKIRSVDAVQFDRRRLAYDFDMIQNRWDQSLSPGNEQSFYWGSAAAGQDGTRNYMGMANPAADAMIAAVLAARDRQELVSAVRALDRVLISGFYVVPLFYAPGQWVARWTHLARPDRTPLSGYLPESWWRRPAGVK
ncbi:MAG TPA: ABC transporter substrate-binding protein, partial [Xanthobacteraceae bacterium]|nr:ABC transporter substrate-binding protein [Xanthobacteraceae bacterium]